MPAYEHVVVVMSMVLGLAVTQLLRGLAQLYRSRKRVPIYWLHAAWVLLMVLFSFLLWWTFWNYRGIGDWNFFRFVLYLSPTIVFYYLTAIAFPDPAEPDVGLREFYFANRVGFFGTFAIYLVVAGITAAVVRGLPVLDPSNVFRLVTVLLMLIALRSASERVHAAVLALSAGLMLAFILVFQLRLG